MKRRAIPILVFIAAAASGGLYKLGPWRASARQSTGADEHRSVAPARLPLPAIKPAEDDHPSRFDIGQERHYSTNLTTQAQVQVGGPRSDRAANVAVKVAGDWRLTVVAEDAAGFKAHGTLSAKVTRLGGAGDAPAPQQQLEVQHGVLFSPEGRVRAVLLPTGLQPVSANIIKTLIAKLSFVQRDSASWEETEHSPSGDYLAAYRWLSPGISFIRKKQHFLPAARQTGPSHDWSVIASEDVFTLDRSGWPTLVEVREELKSKTIAHVPSVTTKTDGNIRLVSSSAHRDLPALLSALSGLIPAEWRTTATVAEQNAHAHDRDVQKVRGLKMGDLLRSAAGSPKGVERVELAAQIEAALRLDPSTTADVVARARAESDLERRSLLVAALGRASTTEASEAVVDLARSEDGDRGLRQQALATLGTIPSTRAGAEALRVAARSVDPGVRSTALLARGSAATVGDDAAVDELLAALRTAATPAEQALYLKALGNTGDSRILPAVQEALRSDDPSVRAAAVISLRLVDSPLAGDLISAALLSDPDAGVRTRAVSATAFGRHPANDELARALRQDADVRVRQAIVELMGSRAHTSTPARTVLAWAATNDPDEQIQKLAQQRLESLR